MASRSFYPRELEDMPTLVDCDDKLCFNLAYQIEILEKEDTVYFFSEAKRLSLHGKIYVQLALLLLEGNHSADELVNLLGGHCSLEVAYYALQKLESKHLIQTADPFLTKPVAAFCGLLDVDMKTVTQKLKTTKICIQDYSHGVVGAMSKALKTLQIEIVETPKEANLILVIANDYLDPEIKALEFHQIPKMLIKPSGSLVWIGPILGTENSNCYQCLVERIKLNRLEETFLTAQNPLKRAPSPMPETLQEIALNFAAQEVLKWIIGKNEKLENAITTVDFLNPAIRQHALPSLAYCLHLEKKQVEKTPIVELRNRKKNDDFRTINSESTLKKYEHLVSPLTGLVKSLDSGKTHAESVIQVYHSGSNWAVYGETDACLANLDTFRNQCGGKGTTEVQAKAGALCEALERLSGRYRGIEPSILATYQELAPHAIHPNSLSHFSQKQYDNREHINKDAHRFGIVQKPFPEKGRIAWTQAWSLTHKCPKYVPTSYCYYKFTNSGEEWTYKADSNGCAAGNCLEEAILQGFCELVERDCVAIWWYNRLQYPKIDLDSFNIPYIHALIEEYAQSNREIHVLDITSDLGIPTCAAISRIKNGGAEKIHLGFGTHLDMESALLRALTEMNQLMGCEPFWEEKEEATAERQWMNHATFANQPYLVANGVRTIHDYQKWKSTDLLEDIEYCRRIVENKGLEFLVLDQTREDIGLNVVRVMVPGLRHFWTRFAPGRLYDVPVQMGKLKTPTDESQLNPIAMFL